MIQFYLLYKSLSIELSAKARKSPYPTCRSPPSPLSTCRGRSISSARVPRERCRGPVLRAQLAGGRDKETAISGRQANRRPPSGLQLDDDRRESSSSKTPRLRNGPSPAVGATFSSLCSEVNQRSPLPLLLLAYIGNLPTRDGTIRSHASSAPRRYDTSNTASYQRSESEHSHVHSIPIADVFLLSELRLRCN
jgi:hypothetical protein